MHLSNQLVTLQRKRNHVAPGQELQEVFTSEWRRTLGLRLWHACLIRSIFIVTTIVFKTVPFLSGLDLYVYIRRRAATVRWFVLLKPDRLHNILAESVLIGHWSMPLHSHACYREPQMTVHLQVQDWGIFSD